MSFAPTKVTASHGSRDSFYFQFEAPIKQSITALLKSAVQHYQITEESLSKTFQRPREDIVLWDPSHDGELHIQVDLIDNPPYTNLPYIRYSFTHFCNAEDNANACFKKAAEFILDESTTIEQRC